MDFCFSLAFSGDFFTTKGGLDLQGFHSQSLSYQLSSLSLIYKMGCQAVSFGQKLSKTYILPSGHTDPCLVPCRDILYNECADESMPLNGRIPLFSVQMSYCSNNVVIKIIQIKI